MSFHLKFLKEQDPTGQDRTEDLGILSETQLGHCSSPNSDRIQRHGSSKNTYNGKPNAINTPTSSAFLWVRCLPSPNCLLNCIACINPFVAWEVLWTGDPVPFGAWHRFRKDETDSSCSWTCLTGSCWEWEGQLRHVIMTIMGQNPGARMVAKNSCMLDGYSSKDGNDRRHTRAHTHLYRYIDLLINLFPLVLIYLL